MKGGQGGETEGTLSSPEGQNPLDLRLLHGGGFYIQPLNADILRSYSFPQNNQLYRL